MEGRTYNVQQWYDIINDASGNDIPGQSPIKRVRKKRIVYGSRVHCLTLGRGEFPWATARPRGAGRQRCYFSPRNAGHTSGSIVAYRLVDRVSYWILSCDHELIR